MRNRKYLVYCGTPCIAAAAVDELQYTRYFFISCVLRLVYCGQSSNIHSCRSTWGKKSISCTAVPQLRQKTPLVGGLGWKWKRCNLQRLGVSNRIDCINSKIRNAIKPSNLLIFSQFNIFDSVIDHIEVLMDHRKWWGYTLNWIVFKNMTEKR